MKAKCSKCEVTGYDHIIDITGMNYDMYETDRPILRNLFDDDYKYNLCGDCITKMRESGMTKQQIRDYINTKY